MTDEKNCVRKETYRQTVTILSGLIIFILGAILNLYVLYYSGIAELSKNVEVIKTQIGYITEDIAQMNDQLLELKIID